MNDDYIIKYFYYDDGRPICSRFRIKSIELNKEISEYLKTRYDYFSSYKETIIRIKYNIENTPRCLTCGKPTTILNNGIARKYCCYQCMNSNPDKIRMGIETSINNFGSDNYNNRKKYKETNLFKYGVDHPWKNKEILEKCFETTYQKYGERYFFNKEEIKNVSLKLAWSEKAKIKRNATNISLYGDVIPVKTKKVSDKLKKIINSKEVKEKKIATYKKNNSFNRSIPEDNSYLLLKEKYPDVIRQYKSELYPFMCDFYIPSIDLYIECNYHWCHGGHPFDKDNIDDINKLNIWKSKNTKYYNNCIKSWTEYDVKKRNIAKENKLNYIEFWSIDELIKNINNLTNYELH